MAEQNHNVLEAKNAPERDWEFLLSRRLVLSSCWSGKLSRVAWSTFAENVAGRNPYIACSSHRAMFNQLI